MQDKLAHTGGMVGIARVNSTVAAAIPPVLAESHHDRYVRYLILLARDPLFRSRATLAEAGTSASA